jgi:hypothetical protein
LEEYSVNDRYYIDLNNLKASDEAEQTEKKTQLHQAMQYLNADKIFRHSRRTVNNQIDNVNETLIKDCDELYFKRKFDLHTLNEQQKRSDQKALMFLLNLT